MMNPTIRYLVNPDVSCREEGPEGALLFNPDTGGMMLINQTGLLIWQALARPHTQDEVISHVQTACYSVPANRVEEDVEAFIQKLLPGGFVGEVLPVDGG